MASIRTAPGPPQRPGDATRTRRPGIALGTAENSAIAGEKQRDRVRDGSIRIPIHPPAHQSKIPSRTAQNTSTRRPAIPTPTGRPSPVHQPQARSLNAPATISPSPYNTNMPTASSPGRYQDGPSTARNILRRKQTNVARAASGSQADSARSDSSSSNTCSSCSSDPSSQQLDRCITESPTEIQVAHAVEVPTTQAHSVTIYPELDRYRDIPTQPFGPTDGLGAEIPYRLATHDLPPPTPAFSGSSSQLSAGSPCTRFSESPGPGPYSRDTTPTSISSQSPGLVAPMRFANHQKPRQLSPVLTRPPVTRRRAGSASNDNETPFSVDPQGLAAVREMSTSSSSNSTVRDVDRREKEKQTTKKKKKRLSPLPPSPPPRKSSQKFRDDQSDSSPKKSGDSTRPPVPSASPSKSIPARPAPTPLARATPPMRPSRENTPDLQSQLFDPLPIVHSNLSSTSLACESRPSEDKPGSSSSLPRRTTPSPVPDKHDATSRFTSSREATPAPRPGVHASAKAETAGKARTPSPNTSTFNTRFPFFSRRAKTTPELPQVDKKDKPVRKGPAAGTGHEGYGRLGSIRRRSGVTGGRENASPGTSQESLHSNKTVDPFLLDRMSPVVISGGEIIHNRNTSSDLSRSESNQSLPLSRPSMDSRGDSDVSAASSASRTAAWASGLPEGPRSTVKARRPSDNSDSEDVTMKSTLAFRRSLQRLQTSPDQEPLSLPKPIDTSTVASPSVTSIDTSIVSDDSHHEMKHQISRGRKASAMAPPKKLTKRTRSPRKWNLFSRSHQNSKKKEEKPEPVSATVKLVQPKPVAFYAMMDGSEQEEDLAPPNVEDILRDANIIESPFQVPIPPPMTSREHLPSRGGAEQENQPLSTQQPKIRRMNKTIGASRDTAKSSPQEATINASSARPSRLPQVGRIPKVVNQRTEPPSRRKSFSRPFNRASYQQPPEPEPCAENEEFIAKGPSPPKPATPDLTHEASTATSTETTSGYISRQTPPGMGKEFLAFSPNKKYQGHSSSDSSSLGNFTFAQTMADVPDPSAPLVEDEIWDEYNDLLGEPPLSATSSKGVPFHLESYEMELPEKKSHALESPTLAPPSAKSIRTTTDSGRVLTESTTYSADMTERIRAAFAPKPEREPETSAKDLDPVSCHEQEQAIKGARKVSSISQLRNSNASRKSRKTNSSASSKSSEDESPMSQVNLRVGSMTVSKWLSFGHVLFSPVRDELLPDEGSLKRQSILVIDGLGNDDWSFYAAETYPSATFFNLSPRAPLRSEQRTSSSFPLSPPNHHQIQYTSHAEKFPFGPESFTSVVYRFPAAAPESYYRNIISEARRVLKPGGYIELSVLDVDLNNMGTRGRRTIRRLKERIHEKTPEVSLGSTSDLVVRLLSKKGFSDMKACRVGVPVASIVSKPNMTKKDSTGGGKRVKDQRSLADMMNDNSDTADENITKMVAKVGRWWYSRCYESAGGTSAASKSIWADRALLAECEELRTSLKLMVCHARVPERSRVASI